MKKVNTYCLLFICVIWSTSTNGQTISSVDPDSADLGEYIDVIISGQNTDFSQGTNVVWFQQGTVIINPYSVSTPSDILLLAGFYIYPWVPFGLYDVHIDQTVNGHLTLTDGFTVIEPTNIQEKVNGNISIYPNPTTGILTIKGIKGVTEVYNNIGKLVKVTSSQTIDISHVPDGIYYLRFADQKEKGYIYKVVKE